MSKDLKKAITQLASVPGEMYSIPCMVNAVDTSKRTCDVQPVNGSAPVFGVKLQSNINLTLGCVLIPKVGSHVIVTWLSKEVAYVALTSEVESTIVTIEDCSIVISKDGTSVIVKQSEVIHTKDGVSLKSSATTMRSEINALVALMDGLLTTLENFQLQTTGAPGPTVAVMPQVLADLALHRADLMTFSNNINTIIAE